MVNADCATMEGASADAALVCAVAPIGTTDAAEKDDDDDDNDDDEGTENKEDEEDKEDDNTLVSVADVVDMGTRGATAATTGGGAAADSAVSPFGSVVLVLNCHLLRAAVQSCPCPCPCPCASICALVSVMCVRRTFPIESPVIKKLHVYIRVFM